MENINNVKEKVDKIAKSIDSIQNQSEVNNYVKIIKTLIESNDLKTLADGVITIYSVVDTENKLIKRSLKELTYNLVDLHHEHLILVIDMKKDLSELKNKKKPQTKKSNNIFETLINNPLKTGALIVFTALTLFGGMMWFYKIDKEAFNKTVDTIKVIKETK